MTDTRNNGGPAFPQISEFGDIAGTSAGMTMRDWFAGQVIGSAYAYASSKTMQAMDLGLRPEEWAAKIALRVADELLFALSKAEGRSLSSASASGVEK